MQMYAHSNVMALLTLLCVYACVRACACVCMHTHAHACTLCLHVCACTCMSVHTYMCGVCLCVLVYKRIYWALINPGRAKCFFVTLRNGLPHRQKLWWVRTLLNLLQNTLGKTKSLNFYYVISMEQGIS